MRAGYARMTGNVAVGGGNLDQRQGIIECRVGLARIVDHFDRAVPHGGDRSPVTDRNEGGQAELRPAVPAFGDDFGPDSGGIAERNRQRSGWWMAHRRALNAISRLSGLDHRASPD